MHDCVFVFACVCFLYVHTAIIIHVSVHLLHKPVLYCITAAPFIFLSNVSYLCMFYGNGSDLAVV